MVTQLKMAPQHTIRTETSSLDQICYTSHREQMMSNWGTKWANITLKVLIAMTDWLNIILRFTDASINSMVGLPPYII